MTVRVPPGVRPTSARVREALFSLVGQDLAGQRILDAYGGTGILGLEAWSRGAEVVIVERSRRAVAAVRGNATALGAPVEIRCADVLAAAPHLGSFDGVMVDPPYALDPEPILSALGPLVDGWLVLEGPADRNPPGVEGLVLDRRRCYGGSALWVYVGRRG